MNDARILIVEDEVITGLNIQNFLKRKGFEPVGIASSGDEAINKTEEHKPDLILMDIILKGEMDGISAAEEIKKRFNIPFIYLTGHSDEMTLNRAKATEPYGYMVKPFNPDELYSTIEIAIYKHGMGSRLRESEERLRLENEKLESLLNGLTATGIGVDIVGIDYRVQHQNKLLYERFGDLTGELCYKGYMEFEEPCDFCPMKKAIENRRVEKVELTASDDRSYELLSAPFPNPDGRIDKVVEVVVDITERKRAEDAVRDERDRVQLYLDIVGSIIIILDHKGRVTLSNRRGCELLGYDEDEIIGKDWTESFIPEREKDNIRKGFARAAAGKVRLGDYYENPVLTRSGEERIIRWNNAVLRDEEGDLVSIISSGEDITDKKKAEDELIQERDFSSMVLDTVSSLVIVLDTEGRIITFNRACEECTGYTFDEVRGRCFWDFLLPEEEAGAVKEVFRELLFEAQPNEYENNWITKDGELRLIEFSNAVLTGPGGSAEYIMSTGIDFTDRRQAELALKESEEKYRNILESIEEGYYETDLNGKFTFFNDSMCKIIGYPRDELIKMDYRGFTTPETVRKIFKIFNQVFRTGEPADLVDNEVIRKDGSRRINGISISLMFDKAGKKIGFRGIARDITERKQAEEALFESEEKYRTILENINEGYFELDLKGNLIFFNDSMRKIFGYSGDELMGINYRKISTPENAKMIYEIFNQVYKTGEPADIVDYEVVRKDGSTRIIEISVTPIHDEAGKTNGFRGMARDITERKRAEEVLRESEERYRTLITEMLNGFALHEIICDEKGKPGDYRFLEVNRAFEEMTGLNAAEVIGKRSLEVLPGLETRWIDTYGSVALTGKPVRFEDYSEPLNRHFEVLAYSPKKNQFATVFIDITERKQSELALKKSEEKYRDLVENINDVIYSLDRKGTIKYVSPVIEAMLDHKASDMIGKNFLEFIHKDDKKRMLEVGKRRYRTGRLDKDIFEFRMNTRSGKTRWCRSSDNAEYEGDTIIGTRGIISDITEQKKAEEAIRESEERFRTIFQESADAISILDDKGFIDCNNAMLELLGFADRESFIGIHPSEISPPFQPDGKDSQTAAKAMIREAYRNGSQKFEWVHRRTDGSDFFAEVNLTAFKSRGEELLQSIVRDITDRKTAEKALEERLKFFTLLSEFSASFVNIPPEKVDDQIGLWLHRTIDFYDFDRSSISELAGDGTYFDRFHNCAAEGIEPLPRVTTEAFPDANRILISGEIIKYSRVDELPEEAVSEKKDIRKAGTMSNIMIPLDVGGSVIGIIAFATVRVEREWSDELIQQLKLIGDVFGNALMRRRSEESLRTSEEKFSRAFMASPIDMGIYSIDTGKLIEANERYLEVSGYNRDEVIGNTLLELDRWVNIEQRNQIYKMIENNQRIREMEIQVRIKSGEIRLGSLSAEIIEIEGKPCLLAMIEDITEKRKLQMELSNIIEQERRRIGQDLHDDLGQNLTGATFLIQSLKQELDEKSYPGIKQVEKIEDLVRNAVTKTRSIAKMLSPVDLGESGLLSAIEEFAAHVEEVFHIRCEMIQEGDFLIEDEQTSANLYYIIREAVNNAIKHGKAKGIEILLNSEGSRFNISIKDDGKGIKKKGIVTGMGLRIMKYRATLIGADIDMGNDENGGFIVNVKYRKI